MGISSFRYVTFAAFLVHANFAKAEGACQSRQINDQLETAVINELEKKEKFFDKILASGAAQVSPEEFVYMNYLEKIMKENYDVNISESKDLQQVHTSDIQPLLCSSVAVMTLNDGRSVRKQLNYTLFQNQGLPFQNAALLIAFNLIQEWRHKMPMPAPTHLLKSEPTCDSTIVTNEILSDTRKVLEGRKIFAQNTLASPTMNNRSQFSYGGQMQREYDVLQDKYDLRLEDFRRGRYYKTPYETDIDCGARMFMSANDGRQVDMIIQYQIRYFNNDIRINNLSYSGVALQLMGKFDMKRR